MVLVRDRDKGPMLALTTTDLTATGADLVARYAARWAIEVTFFDTRQTLGVGQARNRTEQAVARTWAFGMYVYTLVCSWRVLSAPDGEQFRYHYPVTAVDELQPA